MRLWLIATLLAGGLVACARTGAAPGMRGERTNGDDRAHRDVAPRCGERGVAVQVLGSGGPIGDDGRASTGYVLWEEGRARAIVDMGGGTFQRAGSLGIDVTDLWAVLLTHYHVDHTADFPALLKSASFGKRADPLPIVGPGGAGPFPPLDAFLHALLGPNGGAWGYLGGYLDEGQPFRLAPHEVDVEGAESRTVISGAGHTVHAVGVRHGIVPALGYRVDVGGRAIGFTGDQRMDEARFVDMVRGVDLLIAHHAIPEGATHAMAALHAPPSRIGQLAAEAEVGALVLSHHMRRSLERRDESLETIRAHFDGPVALADDLSCFPLSM
jgi:ribonuclease BN (tRNA processing enzyme)